ncbi:MAG: transcription termination/antitermination protein NusG [Pseudomonadales bacterium]|jgi:transcriptional antiterminator NusG|nr:transcription termination/antitermination protein NusG [Pseudomonadales bacterium]
MSTEEIKQEDVAETTENPVAPEVQEVQVASPHVIVFSEAKNDRAKWYIIHVYSGHENKVAEALRQRSETLGLTDQILKVLIPTQEKIQIKRGNRKTVTEKIFPGYMMINMEHTDASWLAVRTTQGVSGFVGMGGGQPTPLTKSEVDAIQKYMTQASPTFKADYMEGEAVRIVDGPFNEFLGTVNSIDNDKGKVEVLVNIFGRETPVELDFLQVQKVK